MVDPIERTLEQTLFQNSYWQWLLAATVAIGSAALALFARRVARRHYQRLASTEHTELMEVPLQVIGKTATLFVLAIALAAGLGVLQLPTKLERVVGSAVTLALFLQLGVWATTALAAWLALRQRSSLEADRSAVGSLGIIGFVARTVVWSLVLLLMLDNLGVDVTTLVAGLGVGGIAVALAVQNVLGDLFASLSITLDKPFVVGDFLSVGEYLGSVEQIGIKSVRLRSLTGEQIVISNADLLNSRVRNYGRMQERRVVFTIGVTYETPRSALQKLPGILEAAVREQQDTRFDRSHLAKFGDFALEFETVYYVLSADYNRHMDIKQRIFFAIHAAFERESIEFAYPTQKLWLTVPRSNAGASNAKITDAGARRPQRSTGSARRGADGVNANETEETR